MSCLRYIEAKVDVSKNIGDIIFNEIRAALARLGSGFLLEDETNHDENIKINEGTVTRSNRHFLIKTLHIFVMITILKFNFFSNFVRDAIRLFSNVLNITKNLSMFL